MKTKHIVACFGVAGVLAAVAPVCAGVLGGGATGGVGGALSGMGMGRFGSVSGQGALEGQGVAQTSFDRPNTHAVSAAKKQTAARAESAGERAGGIAQMPNANTGMESAESAASTIALGSSQRASETSNTAHDSTARQSREPRTATPAAAAKPNATSLFGASSENAGAQAGTGAAGGSSAIDAQRSPGNTSLEAGGNLSGNASSNPQ